MSVTHHRVRRIQFLDREVPILCQNENGPCPLLAICNVLLLRGAIKLRPDQEVVSTDVLIQTVADRLLEANPIPEGASEGEASNKEALLQDVISLLPKLVRGADVNPKFDHVNSFEFTQEISVFDLLDIRLFHGWVADPDQSDTRSVMERLSYNQATDRVISLSAGEPLAPGVEPYTDSAQLPRNEDDEKSDSPSAKKPETDSGNGDHAADEFDIFEERGDGGSGHCAPAMSVPEPSGDEETARIADPGRDAAPAMSGAADGGSDVEPRELSASEELTTIRAFLEETASQLTFAGIVALHQHVRERELAVFFRNNHFSTLFRINDSLFTLVTDIGFVSEPSIVWERLEEVGGMTSFANHRFQLAQPTSPPKTLPSDSGTLAAQEAERRDREFALKLQEEESHRHAGGGGVGRGVVQQQPPTNVTPVLRDGVWFDAKTGVPLTDEQLTHVIHDAEVRRSQRARQSVAPARPQARSRESRCIVQ